MNPEQCIDEIKKLDKHVHPLKGSVRREVIRLLTAIIDARNWHGKDCRRSECDGCDR